MSMEFKDYVTLSFSALAVGISTFNLWWGTFRKRSAFYYISTAPRNFALVNGGKSDLLLLGVKYWFTRGNPYSGIAPPQKLSVDVSNGFLLKAGTAAHIEVVFDNSVCGPLHQSGEPVQGAEGQYAFTVFADIQWFDMFGSHHEGMLKVFNCAMDENAFRSHTPLEQRHDLTPIFWRKHKARKLVEVIEH